MIKRICKLTIFSFFLVFNCAKTEKVDVDDKWAAYQFPTTLSPEEQKKYDDLGWALFDAVGVDDLDGAQKAISNGADIDYIGRESRFEYFPLLLASHRGNVQMVELLLRNGAKINYHAGTGFTCLMDTAVNGETVVAQILLKNKADINAKTDDGVTALIYAVKFSQREMIELFIMNGVDINLEDKYKKTALRYAEEMKNVEIISLLKKSGAIE